MCKYILKLTDPVSTDPDVVSIYLNECETFEHALEEAEAQVDLFTYSGGIGYDERWREVEAKLFEDGNCVWEFTVDMCWEDGDDMCLEECASTYWQKSVDMCWKEDSAIHKYILKVMDPTSTDPDVVSYDLNKCKTLEHALEKAEAEVEILINKGGIAYENRWLGVEAALFEDDNCVWEKSVDMYWEKNTIICKYILKLTDPTSTDPDVVSIYLNECETLEHALEEAEAQVDLFCDRGGIGFDEKWNVVEAALFEDDNCVWEYGVDMCWEENSAVM